MIEDKNVFDSHTPCQTSLAVRIDDGALSKVIGKGPIIISKDITLESILCTKNWLQVTIYK